MTKRAFVLLVPFLGACAAAPMNAAPAAMPSSDAAADREERSRFSNADDAQRALDDADRRLHADVGKPTPEGNSGGSKKEQDAPPPAPVPMTAGASPARMADDKVPAAPAGAAISPCADACRALASMRRAADGLCDLTGEPDDRCKRARGRVADAENLTATCGCQRLSGLNPPWETGGTTSSSAS